MKVTRILHAKKPNKGKVVALREQARRLGQMRSEVWQRFGSIQGVNRSDRQIRDQWLKEQRSFPVSANAWKETLRDAKGHITANLEAAKVKARRCIVRHTQDTTEQKRLYTAQEGQGYFAGTDLSAFGWDCSSKDSSCSPAKVPSLVRELPNEHFRV